MGDLLTVQDLEAAKKHDTFHSEVITGVVGGVSGGAQIDYATNAVTGQQQKTLPAVLRDIGYQQVGTFAAGYTLTNTMQMLLASTGRWYSWSGSFPVGGLIVAPGTDPLSDTVNWIDRTEDQLRDEIYATVRESIRRSYAEVGLNLVEGSFELGGETTGLSDVLLCEADGKAYSWHLDEIKTVPAGSTPATSGGIGAGAWVDRTDVVLRDQLAGSTGATKVGTSDGRTVEQRLSALPNEVDAAGTAASLISQHNSSSAAHPELSAFITAEADRAETARNAAFVNADVYPDIATGLATVAVGDQFQVVEAHHLVRYRKDGESSQTEVSRILDSTEHRKQLSKMSEALSKGFRNADALIPRTIWANTTTNKYEEISGKTGYLIEVKVGDIIRIVGNAVNSTIVQRVIIDNPRDGAEITNVLDKKILPPGESWDITAREDQQFLWVSYSRFGVDVSPLSLEYLNPERLDSTEHRKQLSKMSEALSKGFRNADALIPRTIWANTTTNKYEEISGKTGYLIEVKYKDTIKIVGNAVNSTIVQRVNISNPNDGAEITNQRERKILQPGETWNITAREDQQFLWVSYSRFGVDVSPQSLEYLSTGRLGVLPDDPTKHLSGSVLSYESALHLHKKVEFCDFEVKGFHEVRDIGTVNDSRVAPSPDVYSVDNPGRPSYDVSLEPYDTITFDYYDIFDALVLISGPSSAPRFPVVWGSSNSGEIKTASYTSDMDQVVRIVSVVPGSVRINGLTTENLTFVGDLKFFREARYHPAPGQKRTSAPFPLKEGDQVVVTKASGDNYAIAGRLPDEPESRMIIYVPELDEGSTVRFTAPTDMMVIMSGNMDSKFLIKKKGDIFENGLYEAVIRSRDSNEIITNYIDLGEPSTIFLTTRNYIVKTEVIEGVEFILTSTDLGKTWRQVENIVEKIVYAHMFSDGTLLLANNTTVFWTDDYETLNQSTILDENGDPLTLTGTHFFTLRQGERVTYLNGDEILVWGDYSVSGSPIYIWYTTDRGRTIKVAARFGQTLMGGQARSVRHVHKVGFNKHNGRFYATTGDHDGNGLPGGECMIVIGDYNKEADTWSWEYTNSGNDYKWLNIFFDEHYTYLVADITSSGLRHLNGLWRVPTEMIADKSKLEHLWGLDAADIGESITGRSIRDKHGNMLLSTDSSFGGRFYLSNGGLQFKRMSFEPSTSYFAHYTGANYKGDVYVTSIHVPDAVKAENLRINHPTYNITEAIRKAGLSNFMTGISLTGNEMEISD